jgi:hypothetical protein
MISLVIELRDGFMDDAVLIQVNGVERYNEKGVQTDFSVTRADSFQVQVSEGPVTVDVDVPSRRLTKSIRYDISKDKFLGLSLGDTEIEHEFSDEDFLKF